MKFSHSICLACMIVSLAWHPATSRGEETARIGFAEIIGRVTDWQESEVIKTPWNLNRDKHRRHRVRKYQYTVLRHLGVGNTLHTAEHGVGEHNAHPNK